MLLQELHKGVEIEAANGKGMLALKIFAHALEFFKEHCLQELSDQSSTRITNEDVRWVITVPAIWKQPAKQFMRQAAYEVRIRHILIFTKWNNFCVILKLKAGLASSENPDQLLIALEPEAASIHCRKLKQRESLQEIDAQSQQSKSIPPVKSPLSTDFIAGTRYIVVDCGGGTVDVTVHEVEDGGTLKELHKASGGAWGATGVDTEFQNLLVRIFGQKFIEKFCAVKPAGWVDLMIAFEAKKRTANTTKSNPLNMSLPFSFIDLYLKVTGKNVETAIKNFGDPDVKWSSQGMLRLGPAAMNKLFSPIVNKIVEHVKEMLAKPDLFGVNFLFLVGGFAESALLQSEIRQHFGDRLRVIIPQDPGLAILKGAVMFGLDPTIVRVRRSALTYGVGVLNAFEEGKHPPEKKTTKGGRDWCTDVFDTFVVVDQCLALGDTVVRSYTPAKAEQTSTIISIFSCNKEHAMFTTDPGVKRCGELHLDMPDTTGGNSRELQMMMMFGDTEIKVEALDLTSGQKAHASIDFLNK